jgi:hypothetical protein
VRPVESGFDARWQLRDGREGMAIFATQNEAIRHTAKVASGGPRFHDLRHTYATWLVTQGVPVNVVRTVMGHEQTSTTLDLYTHAPTDYEQRVIAAFEDPAVFLLHLEAEDRVDEPEADDDDRPRTGNLQIQRALSESGRPPSGG